MENIPSEYGMVRFTGIVKNSHSSKAEGNVPGSATKPRQETLPRRKYSFRIWHGAFYRHSIKIDILQKLMATSLAPPLSPDRRRCREENIPSEYGMVRFTGIV
jgi:hypothetical protein